MRPMRKLSVLLFLAIGCGRDYPAISSFETTPATQVAGLDLMQKKLPGKPAVTLRGAPLNLQLRSSITPGSQFILRSKVFGTAVFTGDMIGITFAEVTKKKAKAVPAIVYDKGTYGDYESTYQSQFAFAVEHGKDYIVKVVASSGKPMQLGLAVVQTTDQGVNTVVAPVSNFVAGIVFTPVVLGGIEFPIVLIILLVGATFFTLRFRFPNFRLFRTAIRVVSGKYDHLEPDEKSEGELTHFQALASAVSGTVGLGNIAGVAVAISLGGPGATFWMILAGLLGMSSKFVECTLGVKYRETDNGQTFGGPMYYLKKGLAERGLVPLGKFLAVLFALFAIGGSFGGGNMFQSNQAAQLIINEFDIESGMAGLIIGLIFAVLVGMVIIGGIKRIGKVAGTVVPAMACLYLFMCLIVLILRWEHIGWAFGQIFSGAFTGAGVAGGFVGVLFQGFKRAAFSNEAGIGSAAIAHSAVKTSYPASEGIVALLEPFIDTVVICTLTALVIIVTGAADAGADGIIITSNAFAGQISWGTTALTIAVVLFAFSTMLSWSYYGIQAWKYLFGRGPITDLVYKLMFLTFTVIGAASTLGPVILFSDSMIFAMLFPNMIGLFFLYPKVKDELHLYLQAIRSK